MPREIRSLLSTDRGHSCLRKDLVPWQHQMSVSCALASHFAEPDDLGRHGLSWRLLRAREPGASRTECHSVPRNRKSIRHAGTLSGTFRASERFRIRFSCLWHDAGSRCPWILKTSSTLLSPCTKCRNHRVPCRRTEEECTPCVTWFDTNRELEALACVAWSMAAPLKSQHRDCSRPSSFGRLYVFSQNTLQWVVPERHPIIEAPSPTPTV